MRYPDPLALKRRLQEETFIFASCQNKGTRKIQGDYVGNVNDECFVVADGAGGMPHADTAAIVASEAALWGYKHIRLRPFYWADKRLLLKRIFRSSNMTVWQKRREAGFETGLATTLSVAIIGSQKIWVGSVGDTSILLYRDGLIDFLTPLDVDRSGNLTNALGLKRLGCVPHVTVEKFFRGDILILATDGVTGYVKEEELRAALEVIGNTTQSISDGASRLIKTAQDHGSTDNMTVCMIKRVA
jgi:serine/threonine protein phosphatase PrpC